MKWKREDFLGDAVHIDGEADAAVANQGEAQFLFPHRDNDSALWGAPSPFQTE